MFIFLLLSLKLNETHEYKNALNSEQEQLNIARIETEETENQEIDFDYMKSINKNIVAWITIPGTSIDSPILQASDNQYYLNHSFSNVQNDNGAIFVDYKNTNDFNDRITSIYGHNVSNEYMLGSISKYKDANFMQNHPNIEIHLNDNTYTYAIDKFSEVNMKEVSSEIYNNIEPNKNKLILITCSYSNGKSLDADLRYVLVATKI